MDVARHDRPSAAQGARAHAEGLKTPGVDFVTIVADEGPLAGDEPCAVLALAAAQDEGRARWARRLRLDARQVEPAAELGAKEEGAVGAPRQRAAAVAKRGEAVGVVGERRDGGANAQRGAERHVGEKDLVVRTAVPVVAVGR